MEKVRISNVVLLGLDDDLALKLGKTLADQGHVVHSCPFLQVPECLAYIKQAQADLAFCPAEPKCNASLLEAIRQEKPDFPLIAVSPRLPNGWLPYRPEPRITAPHHLNRSPSAGF